MLLQDGRCDVPSGTLATAVTRTKGVSRSSLLFAGEVMQRDVQPVEFVVGILHGATQFVVRWEMELVQSAKKAAHVTKTAGDRTLQPFALLERQVVTRPRRLHGGSLLAKCSREQ